MVELQERSGISVYPEELEEAKKSGRKEKEKAVTGECGGPDGRKMDRYLIGLYSTPNKNWLMQPLTRSQQEDKYSLNPEIIDAVLGEFSAENTKSLQSRNVQKHFSYCGTLDIFL